MHFHYGLLLTGLLLCAWATWCGPCVSEFDDLVETYLRFRHRDFETITIAAQFPDQKDKVLAFLQKHYASTQNFIYGETDAYAIAVAVFSPPPG
jgi:thiol-disulfide isomerase/thioredoxin